ncbi:hypothetical protein OJ997_04910 [Solirubrobacter phytolaccae]|uniref:GAF domain-containing protein n=1 Tax=Solirubrobacter phytolaccae TaxID=1404360 RepID=A0A9X3SDE1_9ACTN|nr:hypothetical protein [Solirubrobacter phytolaccae]MDA0179627.1 hypothetical protein [Solirubrobacter phytolaccae]
MTIVPAVDVFRAPMRARDRELPPGAGAAFGLAHGVVGIGDALAAVPASLDEAVAQQGGKAGRMLERFASLDDGVFVWTRDADGWFHLGRVCGPWRYDDGAAARAVGIHHVRPAEWLDEPVAPDAVPAAVADTFARGGRNLQRIRGVEERTLELWDAAARDA